MHSSIPVASGALAQREPPEAPRLYVGGLKISEYTLGSTKPLLTVNAQYDDVIALVTDSFGHLFAEYGNPTSGAFIDVLNARTLTRRGVIPNTAGWGAIAVDSRDNLYYCFGDPVWVYPPGYTQPLYKIKRNARDVNNLAFDASGDLFTDGGDRISEFAPNGPDGRMKWVRSFRDGVHNSDALAFGPNGNLYVADYTLCNPPCGRSFVEVYPPGASQPSLTIEDGIEAPVALAIDSDNMLYVAERPYRGAHPRVEVYAPGGTKPIRTIKGRMDEPHALAVDPSNNLYVANANSVNVYSPGGAKLLYKITKGIRFAGALAIGRP